jgi:hypothetical protein
LNHQFWMHRIIFMEFQTCRDLQKHQTDFLRKREAGRGCGAEPGRPKSGGLPGVWLTELVRRRPIQISRCTSFLLRGAAHAGEGDEAG